MVRAAVSAGVAAVIIAGTETVAGYPRPSSASSSFFGFAALSYFPLFFAVSGLLSLASRDRGLDLWFPVVAGLVRAGSALASEVEPDLAARVLPVAALGLAIIFLASRIARSGTASPPFMFASTVGMVLPILLARVGVGVWVARFASAGQAAALGAVGGLIAFLALRGLVARWPKVAPLFLLGPLISLGLWSQQGGVAPGKEGAALSGGAAGPDIVLIVLDTVRARSLPAYGYDRNTMPALEAFARQATTFERVWTNGSWTLPAHISLFSGLRLTHHLYDSGFSATERSSPRSFLAPRLRAKGYATAAVAANFGVLGREEPALFGFDHVEVEPLRPFGFKPWLFDLIARFPRASWLRPPRDRFRAPAMRAPWVVERSLKWWAETRGEPRFLFVNFMDAHLPWVPPAEDLGRFGPVALEVESEQLSVLGRYRTGGRPTAAEIEILRNRYDESLSSLDRSMAQLIDGITAGPRGGDTIVVVTSDHGESLGEHDRFGHRNSLDEVATRIPLVIRGPGLSRGDRRDAPVQLTDVFAYLARAAGLEVETGLDSRPFGERSVVIIEHRPGPQGALPSSYPRGDLSALVEWPFKYVEGPSAPGALFNLAMDAREEVNLEGAEPARAASMRARLRELSAVPSSRGLRPPDPAAEERLRALGYVR